MTKILMTFKRSKSGRLYTLTGGKHVFCITAFFASAESSVNAVVQMNSYECMYTEFSIRYIALHIFISLYVDRIQACFFF